MKVIHSTSHFSSKHRQVPDLSLRVCVAATLVDCCTTSALVTQDTRGSVTLSLNINYLAGMPAGEDCRIESSVLRSGARIAVLECTLSRASTGSVVAKGTHIKSFVLPPKQMPTSRL